MEQTWPRRPENSSHGSGSKGTLLVINGRVKDRGLTQQAEELLKANPMMQFTLRQMMEFLPDGTRIHALSSAMDKLVRDRRVVVKVSCENPTPVEVRCRRTVNAFQWRMPWHLE